MDASMEELNEYEDDDNVMLVNAKRSLKNCSAKNLRVFLLITVGLLVLSSVFVVLYLQLNKHDNKVIAGNNNIYGLAQDMLETMDITADPCDDFYQYSCGGWLRKTEMPKDKNIYNNFVIVKKETQEIVKRILIKLERNYSKISPLLQQSVTFYNSCMKIQSVEHVSSQLKSVIKKLGSWPVTDLSFSSLSWDFKKSLVETHKLLNGGMLFKIQVSENLRNTNKNIIMISVDLSQNLLYNEIATDILKQDKLKAITKYLGKSLFADFYITQALELSEKLSRIETNILKHINQSLNARYEVTTLEQLATDTEIPIHWLLSLAQMLFSDTGKNIKRSEPVAVMLKEYIKQVYKAFTSESINVQATYFIANALRKLDTFLPPNYEATMDNLTPLSKPDRGEVCLSTTVKNFEFVLSKPFVEEVYDNATISFTKKMTSRIKKIFIEQIHTMTWIDATTRALAERKMRLMKDEIGFPNYIYNNTAMMSLYGGMNINQGEYFLNCLETLKLKSKKNKEKYGKPFDKSRWKIGPTTVNAIHFKPSNQIFIPVAISQTPFYRKNAPHAVNFGGLGIIVGHEMIHGFDDTGIDFDHEGDLESWWTKPSLKEFRKRAQCLVEQYNNYEIYGYEVDGKHTLGENIADNGGVRQTFLAYLKLLENLNMDNETLEGINLNAKQLYFLSVGQTWCGMYKDTTFTDYLVTKVDTHSPNKFRVNGPLRNMKEFSDTFKCPLGSKMNPVKKCRLW